MLLTAGIPESEAWEHVSKVRVIDRLREEKLVIDFKSESGLEILKSFITSAPDSLITESGILSEENYVQEDALEYEQIVNGGISVKGLWQGIVKAMGGDGEEEEGEEGDLERVVIDVIQVLLERLLTNAPKFIRSIL